MRVSVSWLQHYLGKVKIMPPGGIDELVEKIGAQLGAVEGVEYLGDKYKDIVLAKVVSCELHPDANKLHVCKIDDGGKVGSVERDADGHVQVICGAPNVREGLLVAWLPPGATVPSSFEKEPFVLEARKIRGQVSNGMLASLHELAISDDHSGIVEISPEDGKPGDTFLDAYKLDDYIIDIENKMFTHRPDCFGMLGVAREIAGITGQPFTSPEIYTKTNKVKNDSDGVVVKIDNKLPELVPSFLVQVFEDVKVGPSPLWLQTYLSRVGLRPINNIVDITNYFMLQTAQPLHAYDYDKVKALSGSTATITIRHPKPGEKVKLLNGKEIEPRKEAIMIATDKQLIGVGGVMGGSETEVDANTKTIILECASFNMFSIRRTSMEHGLFTDAVTRFSKGQSPLQCEHVLAWAKSDIEKLTGAKAGNIYDDGAELEEPLSVTVETDFINDRLGSKLKTNDMAKLLENVECLVEQYGDKMVVTPPFWRTDLEIPEDIVEEVGRLYGYDKLPADLPSRSMQAAPRNANLDFKARVRAFLSAAGANEVLTYSFVHGELLQKAGQDPEHAYRLTNALSPELQHYRLSLTPSLLDKVHGNIKAGNDELALFEMNVTHSKQHTKPGKLPEEADNLSLVYAASDKAHHAEGAPYYQARHYLTTLLAGFGVSPQFTAIDKELEHAVAQPFEHSRSALVSDAEGKPLGIIGEFKASVRRNLKLPAFAAGFELRLDAIRKSAASQKQYVSLPKFPSVQQDISLRVPAKLSYQSLYEAVWTSLEKIKPANSRASLTPLDIYQNPKDTDHKQVTLRLVLAAYDRTLVAEEVNKLLDDVAAATHQQVGAQRI